MKRILLLLLSVSIVGSGLYWWWTTTPQYAVLQAGEAIKTHDLARFHQWVDVQSVSSNAVDELLSEPARNVGGPWLLERLVGFTIMSIFKPNIVDAMDHQIDTLVQRSRHATAGAAPYTGASPPGATSAPGDIDNTSAQSGTAASDDDDADQPAATPPTLLGKIVAAIKPPSLKEIFKQAGFTKQNFRGLGQVDTTADTAYIGLRFFVPKLQKEVQVRLELTRSSGHWQVSDISNLQEIAGIIRL